MPELRVFKVLLNAYREEAQRWEEAQRALPPVSEHPYKEGAASRIANAKTSKEPGHWLGKLRGIRKSPGHYVATCGGCAHEQAVEAEDRFWAKQELRSLGWRDRSVPGVTRRRHFCPACQRDQDWSMMFAFASPVLAEVSQEELKSRALQGWSAGNPRFLQPTNRHDGT